MKLRELAEWLLDWEEDLDKEVCFLEPMPFGAKYEQLTIQSDRNLGNKVIITNTCERVNVDQEDMFA